MKTTKHYLLVIFFLIAMIRGNAQDPSFSQFFSSPLNINPALTANINADWRFISNFRDQWVGPASPYTTGTVSFDSKLMQNKVPNVPEGNYMGIGSMLMFDEAMSGIVKSTYGSLNLSYSIKLTETEDYTERLAVGFGAIYGHRSIDFSKVDFEEQFTGMGFNKNLPTGEEALSNMKSYISASAGITYSATMEKSNFDVGIAGFHLNKPKQTFLKDDNQILPVRKVAHANFETFINDQWILNTNAIYQYQGKANYLSVGGALGYNLQDEAQSLVMFGLWYWSENALVPYVGLAYKDLQFGLSYDVTTSKLNQAARRPSTCELSIIYRGARKASGFIPCAWK